MRVDKNSIIGDVIDKDPNTAEFFMEIGMHCITCPVSRMESIEEACGVHGVDPDELIEVLNNYFEKKEQSAV